MIPHGKSTSLPDSDIVYDHDYLGTVASHAPETLKRPYRLNTDTSIEKPYVARASYAPDVEHPQGTPVHAQKYKDYSVLQQHCLFWDRDGDGQIWPWDTYIGFRDLGFNIIFSLFAVYVINVCFSFPTRLAHSYLPDPFFRFYLPGAHKSKHGSDSGVYDTEGRFIPSRFEDMFTKYAYSAAPADSLSGHELFRLIHGQRVAVDPYGWSAAVFEWGTTYLLIQKGGRISKEDLRRVYDGSLFWEIKARRQTKEGWNKGWGLGGDGFVGGEKLLPFRL
ncbi:Caleosin related protein-domain-containing protein [Rhodofomes roseus]|uniref:Caleosin related protein-domain-containing protein n=1 Tax=Rhodofomes roseus TaxID=34475 RepID=A0ABQ8K2B7_9APHY|nr:Caleosin related protein-domain-containing protein [Rhodofomes roseus]KAH9830900.1 Caleosin related protein-domain-containing protein [Rhodofomes roseus]